MTQETLQKGIKLQELIKQCDDFIAECLKLKKADELFLTNNCHGEDTTLYFQSTDKESLIDYLVERKKKEKEEYEKEFSNL